MRLDFVRIQWLAAACCVLVFAGCKPGKRAGSVNAKTDSLAIREAYSSSPALSPQESLKTIKLEDGFTIKLVASEPLVSAPTAMLFDPKGRMWVLEMQNYMPDTSGTGEDKPTGKIVILEDTNKDGVMDTRKVFMDSLVLPRAICFVEDGMLVAEPPRLWYVADLGDHAGKKILVDSTYAAGGNVEHQPNGLYRTLDNWIYSANSGRRYKKSGTRWLTEKTISRGQWGISQDDAGRLFYNNNSENLLGDYFAPRFSGTNDQQKRTAGFDEKIIGDNKVYPARATTGVNRGYMKGVLDDSLRLTNFTAASGPVIYRGDLFPKEYQGNAFLGEPSANLIKRDILDVQGLKVKGRQAYKNKEFLTSTDERFRPVTIYNGPDGALYVIDMYRGIIQHKTYITPYLKNEVKIRELTNPLNCGRIYKIFPTNKKPVMTDFPSNPDELVKLLQHQNGWVRDKAQQLLVDGKFKQVGPALRTMAANTNAPVPMTQSLWTLEGLSLLTSADVLPLLAAPEWQIRMQALSLVPSVMSKANVKKYIASLDNLLTTGDTLAAPYVAFLAQSVQAYDKIAADRLLLAVINKYPRSQYVAGAVISGLKGRETPFLKELDVAKSDTTIAVYRQLKRVIYDIANSKKSTNLKSLAAAFPQGAALFTSTCQTCHGGDGNGIVSLAPPLNNSDWVTGDKNKLIPLILYGLGGPVMVNNRVYGPPEINGEMPGMGYNPDMTDEQLAQVMSFIRKAWNNSADKITAADVTAVRTKMKGRQKAFTQEELKKLN